ncbi:MAG: menaquinone biosynthesis protein [Sediminibacterium sp.]|nr:menaquinone biosynthesis protein [Sediminibacterium sp.]
MKEIWSIGAVSYLNTKPLLFGVERSGLMRMIDLKRDYPANIASALLHDKIDIGLVPVAVLPLLEHYEIVTDYCIGTNGTVASVALFSQVPLEEIKTIQLDYQSRTSVNLVRILCKYHWELDVNFKPAAPGFEKNIQGNEAAVVIGDRAFAALLQYPYVYDLGQAWKDFTGLPFVFAVWAANKAIDSNFLDGFNMANGYGVQHIDEVLEGVEYPLYDLKTYYTENIDYRLNDAKRQAIQVFHDYLKALPPLVTK